MKGNPKQDDPLIQNLHDAGCSQQIIEAIHAKQAGREHILPNAYSYKTAESAS